MPYFELSQFLITQDEIQQAVSAVKNEHPQYLFVDTDIDRNLNTGLVNKGAKRVGYVYKESEWLVQRLNLLKEVFNVVRQDYEPVEKALLVTVYRKKHIWR